MASSNLKPRNQNIALDKNSSVAVQVHYHLRQQILRLNLKPGIALSEKELSLQLGVSRTPVREAFIRLSEEGLVDIFPQRGTIVAPIRMDEIKEAQFLREILETAIVRRAAENIEKKFLNLLEANLAYQKNHWNIQILLSLWSWMKSFIICFAKGYHFLVPGALYRR